ncbi:MAG: tRNA glutamyl-Q(34) synthetase GluQRS [Desulfuromonadales bacterium]|nr:tRNA glutamyl-Q(34) synthetase GluQRS [Desulfuromonadales bacterium]MBN2792674.1 tRNA glutamyl-Q(34) synthetase GluQRS [Desulfuromonadales bacterium]
MDNIPKSSVEPIVGRFAPSPTGPLHFGTLLAALGSYLAAKQSDGDWLVRIEDLDQPRVVEGSAAAMVSLLEELGFEWDGRIIYQSRRYERYREILEQLLQGGHLFACSCTRREIIASAPHPGEDGYVYPGTCRNGPRNPQAARAIRLRVNDQPIVFEDMLYGEWRQNLQREVGDFVLQRADGVFAYQLAVVVDDMDSGVNQVVRGADLLSSTPRQIFLHRCLGISAPRYLHLPLALGPQGEKLSKRHEPRSLVNRQNASLMIWRALEFFAQEPPEELIGSPPKELLAWAREHFQFRRIRPENRGVSFS